MAEPAPGLRLQGLCKIFGPRPHEHLAAVRAGLARDVLQARHGHVLALRDVSLQLPGGAISVVMGLSGSGKSTLLRHLNRLIEPTAGQVWCGEIEVTALDAVSLRAFRRQQMAMVFQRFALLPQRTAMDNVAYALELRGVPRREREDRAGQWLARVGLAGQERSWPATLSGGMQQRVGLARALAADAPVLLMDEAFSALDPLHRVDMQDLLLGLQRELHKTVVFVSHDLDEALRLADHLVILRDGEVLQQGSATDIVLRPVDAHVRRFVRDVDRGRLLRCAALAQRAPPVVGPTLAADLSIAEAARVMAGAGAPRANVVDADGQHRGTLSLVDVVAQMAGPATD
jgi:glycine betaine/proline transport system ATP-binding protein